MRLLSLVLWGGAMMLGGLPHAAQAQATSGPASVYVITYFEVAPADAAKVADALREFAAETRKTDGNIEFTALDEVERSARFAMLEAWRDKAALEAHAAATKTLSDKLQPLFLAPFDTRQFVPLSIATTPADASLGTAMYVLTHVDVLPAGKDVVTTMVEQLAEDSRKDKGAERFEVVVWDGRPNHFHLIEAWSDHLAREAHASADHTRAFRAKLVPFEGALYDERLYQVIR